MTHFSGSYKPEYVEFLLKEISMTSTSIEDKEKKIQNNSSHYSEMITHESIPNDTYMKIFYESLKMNEEKFSQHLVSLAHKIHKDYAFGEITIVSLARAGTPIGILCSYILEKLYKRKVKHYSISIFRDKGIDFNAISHIISQHKDKSLVFVDGWTGKGVIGRELNQSISLYNKIHNCHISSHLYVVSDIAGSAYFGATSEDYLIPSAVLNSTISGLVSRTILNRLFINEHDFHGCVYYDNLKKADISNWFIEHMISIIQRIPEFSFLHNKAERKTQNISNIMAQYNIAHENFIKPGIGESTRVLLRRVPKLVLVKNKFDQNIQHILFLAKEKEIPIIEDNDLDFNAISIIDTQD